VAGTGRLFWGDELGGREGREAWFWIWGCNWVWILDSGFLGLIFISFLFSPPPLERARRRHLHQRRAWAHRFRAPAWAVRLLANEVMIYDTEAGRTARLSVLAFLGFLFSENGICWEGERWTTRMIEKGIRRKYNDCNYTINFFSSTIKTLYHSVHSCALLSRKSTITVASGGRK